MKKVLFFSLFIFHLLQAQDAFKMVVLGCIEELHQLAKLASLKNLKVIVTHIKDTSPLQSIEQELEKLNDLSIQFLFPIQGQQLDF